MNCELCAAVLLPLKRRQLSVGSLNGEAVTETRFSVWWSVDATASLWDIQNSVHTLVRAQRRLRRPLCGCDHRQTLSVAGQRTQLDTSQTRKS
jgi:hypothetical protein